MTTGRVTLIINIVSGKTKDSVQILEISATPESNDVIGLQDLYLRLDSSIVNSIVDDISSVLTPLDQIIQLPQGYSNGNIIR